MSTPRNVPLGFRLLAGFFAFGASMCALTLALLLCPGTPLDRAWRLNPEAQLSFKQLGTLAVPLMVVVGVACASAAIGLWRGRRWAILLAIVILLTNLCGDLANVILRHDYRTLVGIPIALVLVAYLWRQNRIRRE